MMPSGGYAQSALVSGSYAPVGIAVDGGGNVYFTDWTGNQLWQLPAGASTPTSIVSSGLSEPGLVALDGAGNLYIANYGDGQVVEVPWTVSGYNSWSSILTGLNDPFGVAVDGSGDIYVSNSTSGSVLKETLSGGIYTPSTVQTSTLSSPYGIALDSGGNLYIADSGNNRVLKEDFADPPSLSFADTIVTLTSIDSAKTVQAVNIGNENLLFEGPGNEPSYPTDFPENTGDLNLCTSAAPLVPAAACDLSVNFTPTVAGNLNEYLVLTDNTLNAAGPLYATQSILLSGTGLPQPTVLVAPSSVPFSNQVQGTTSNAWTLTLNNTSNLEVLNINMSIVGTNPNNFTIQGTTCGQTLDPYSTCLILVTFNPSITPNDWDYYSATLQINDDAVGHPQTIPLSGTGIAMSALLSPGYVNFGTQTVGATSSGQTVILTNASSGTLTVNSIVVSETDGNPLAFGIASSTCGSLPFPPTLTLGPNSSCTITLTFTPGSAMSYSGLLKVTDNGQGGSQTATLSGAGAGQNVFLSPTSINFSPQTVGSTSNAWTVTFNNTSSLPVTGVSVSIGATNQADFAETTTCTGTLAANSTCNIFVTFTPQSANSFNGTLVVASSAGAQTAYLNGTGTAATSVLAPNQLNFGSVKQGSSSSAQVATLTNTSGGPLTVSSVVISAGSANFTISADTCLSSSPLAAYATCTISVVFTPSGVGDYTGTLKVVDSGAGSPLTTSLAGTGTSNSASVFFAPASISFGNQTVGSTGNTWGVTLNNTGGADLTGLNVSSNTTNFIVSGNTCGSSLAANSVCSLQIAFSPTALGSLYGSLTATYTGGSLTALLNGVGIAPTVSLAPSSLNLEREMQRQSNTIKYQTQHRDQW